MIGIRVDVEIGIRSVPVGLTRSINVSIRNPEAFEVEVVMVSRRIASAPVRGLPDARESRNTPF
jgi:hypothetical protein